jgi:hypothetical protein
MSGLTALTSAPAVLEVLAHRIMDHSSVLKNDLILFFASSAALLEAEGRSSSAALH